MGRSLGLGAVLAIVAMAATSCSTPGSQAEAQDPSAACSERVAALVLSLQAHVDRYAGMSAIEFVTRDEPPEVVVGLQEEIAIHERNLQVLGCPSEQLRSDLAEQLWALTADGTIAAAVADALRADLLGGETSGSSEVQVAPGDDLAAELVTAPPGSTIVLEAGDHEVDEPLLAIQHVTIRGAGSERTRIVSTAEEVGLFASSTARFEARGLTFSVEGPAGTVGLIVQSASYRLADLRVGGARAVDDGEGGVGILLEPGGFGPPVTVPAEVDGPPHRGLVEDVVVSDNEAAGIALASGAAPTLRRTTAENNGCGICYLGSAGGSLDGAEIAGNDVGIMVGGSSDPTISDSRVEDNREVGVASEQRGAGRIHDSVVESNGPIGINLADEARLEVVGSEVRGHDEAGIAVAGESRARLEDNDLVDNHVGIIAQQGSAPDIDGNRLRGNGTAGIVVAGTSQARVADNQVTGLALGIEARGQSRPTLVGNTAADAAEVAFLFRDDATGRLEGNTCPGSRLGIVVVDAAEPELAGNDCRRDSLG